MSTTENLASVWKKAAVDASVKKRSLNRVRSTTGWSVRRSHHRNGGSRRTNASAPTTTAGAVQPSVPPSDNASSKPPRKQKTSTLPGPSTFSRAPGATRRSVVTPHTVATTPTGTLNQNTQRQPAAATSAPPSDGPI